MNHPSCKEFGHFSNQHKKKSCKSCKKPDHLIADCPKCPQNRDARTHPTTAIYLFPLLLKLQLSHRKLQALIHLLLLVLKPYNRLCRFYPLWYSPIMPLLAPHDTSILVHQITTGAPEIFNLKPYTGPSYVRTVNNDKMKIFEVGSFSSLSPFTYLINFYLSPSLMLTILCCFP